MQEVQLVLASGVGKRFGSRNGKNDKKHRKHRNGNGKSTEHHRTAAVKSTEHHRTASVKNTETYKPRQTYNSPKHINTKHHKYVKTETGKTCGKQPPKHINTQTQQFRERNTRANKESDSKEVSMNK